MNIKDRVNNVRADIEQPRSYNLGPEVIAGVRAAQRTGPILLTEGTSNYWLSDWPCAEALVFAYALACVEIVLMRSNGANNIFHDIMRAWRLPGCQSILDNITPLTQTLTEVFIHLTREQDNLLAESEVTVARINTNSKYVDLKEWFQSDRFKQLSEHPDFQYLLNRVKELILAGFNRKIDQENEIWKVTPETSSLLTLAIIFVSVVDYKKIQPLDSISIKVLDGDKLLEDSYKMPSHPSTRGERSIKAKIRKAAKHERFVRRNNSKLREGADQWYKCRVNPGSTTGYLIELADQNPPKIRERSRISLDLAPYDEATGYPRQWRK